MRDLWSNLVGSVEGSCRRPSASTAGMEVKVVVVELTVDTDTPMLRTPMLATIITPEIEQNQVSQARFGQPKDWRYIRVTDPVLLLLRMACVEWL